jgi:TonB family protein
MNNAPPRPLHRSFLPENKEPSSWRNAALWALLSTLFHFLILWFGIPVLKKAFESPPSRLTVTSVTPEELTQLKEKLRRESEGKFLLAPKEESAKTLLTPPKEARFSSDRNRSVEQETRARSATSSVPRSGGGATDSVESAPPKPVIPLSKLGLSKRSPQPPRSPVKSSRKAGEPGSSQPLVLENQVPEGSETLLNTRESKYYSFYARIQEAIAPIWESSARQVPQRLKLQPGDYRTEVLFELNPAGKLTRISVLSSSNVQDFDLAATRSIERVAEFPNPPKDLLESDDRIRITLGFVFRLSNSGNVRWLPPQR